MSTFEGTIFDAADELGLGFADVDYRMHVTVVPGSAATFFEPDASPTVELDAIEIVDVRPQDGTALTRPLTAAEIDRVRDYVDRETGREWGDISRRIVDGDGGCLEPDLSCLEDDA